MELETDKATIEVPSPLAGTVKTVSVGSGDTVSVGQTILTLVGTESDSDTNVETSSEASSELSKPVVSSDLPSSTSRTAPKMDPSRTADAGGPKGPVLAAPSIRRLARKLGVEISQVLGTGDRGRITLEDVEGHAKKISDSVQNAGVSVPAESALPDFSKWGQIDRVSATSVRRATAKQMSLSWRMVPRVTQHDRSDITQFDAFRKKIKRQSADLPLTITALTIQVLTDALKKFPQFNASLDVEREEIIYKHYINIGVAVDTDRGLLVPVIKNADQKSLVELAEEISTLAEKARNKGVSIEDLDGGTFTVTNLGAFGGTSFTPVVNYPEVAILGLSKAEFAPVFIDQQFEPRRMLPLSLSYDHRLIDGADGVRFLRWVAQRLEQVLSD